MPLATFFASSRLLAEALVQADGWKRNVAGHDILIESLGDPACAAFRKGLTIAPSGPLLSN